jgi:DNA-binding LytR/AlgR family response regulator
MKVVIIEDEKLTARDLAKTLVQVEPSIEVLAMLTSVEEAIAYLKTSPDIDLIFSDIDLGDGFSFEIFDRLRTQTPIVFCTAHDQYSLKAFATTGIDYLLKPFSRAAIEKTLAKYQALKTQLAAPTPEYPALVEVLRHQLGPKNPSVIVHHGEKIIPIKGSDIALFYIEGEHTLALTFNGQKHQVGQTLDALEQAFAPQFFRANRQYLLNRQAVKEASNSFHRKIQVHLTIAFPSDIIVGKLRTTAFVEWLATQ